VAAIGGCGSRETREKTELRRLSPIVTIGFPVFVLIFLFCVPETSVRNHPPININRWRDSDEVHLFACINNVCVCVCVL